MSQPQQKLCPRCQAPAPLDALTCLRAGCGHQFRTQFAAPDRTMLSVPAPPAQQPPPQNPPQQQNVVFYQQAQPAVPGDYIQIAPGLHSPTNAVLLTILLCSFGGQIYNRQPMKGVVMGLAAIVLVPFTAGISVFITWPVLIIDAYCIAKRLQRGEPIRPWQFF